MLDLKRVVNWTGSITQDSTSRILAQILELHKERPEETITLILSSSGGQSASGFVFCDLISALNVKLDTIGTGYVDSTAVIIFLAGKRRLITPHTSMTIHQASRNFSGSDQSVPLRGMQRAVKDLGMTSNWYRSLVAKKTKLTINEIRDMELQETVLYPGQILKLGFAHGIFK